MFDVTSKQSLVNAERWLKLYNDNKVAEGYSMLVGNKIDLAYRVVTHAEGQAVADSLKVDYFEISAKTGQNIDQLFLHLIDKLVEGKTNGHGNFLDAVKDEIKEEKEEDKDDAGGAVRRSRRQQEHPVDTTTATMNPNNISYSQPHVAAQFQPNSGQGSAPAMVIYTTAPPPVSPNIILSNVQPPPI